MRRSPSTLDVTLSRPAHGGAGGGSRPGCGTICRQLRAALAKLEGGRPEPSAVRYAHEMAGKALAGLSVVVDNLAAEDAEGHRRHAVRQAKVAKDVRGYRRAPVTMPGYHLGRVSPVKGRRFEPTPPNVNDILRMLAAAPGAVMATRGKCPSRSARKSTAPCSSVAWATTQGGSPMADPGSPALGDTDTALKRMKIVVREVVEREFEINEQEFRDWYDQGSDEFTDAELDEFITHTDNWDRGVPPAFLVPTDSPDAWREVSEVYRVDR